MKPHRRVIDTEQAEEPKLEDKPVEPAKSDKPTSGSSPNYYFTGAINLFIPRWEPYTNYSVGDVIQIAGELLTCLMAGTSGSSFLTWHPAENMNGVLDGSVLWLRAGTSFSSLTEMLREVFVGIPAQPNQAFAIAGHVVGYVDAGGTLVVDPNALPFIIHFYQLKKANELQNYNQNPQLMSPGRPLS